MNYQCHRLGGVTAATITVMYAYQGGMLDRYAFHIDKYVDIPIHLHPYIIPIILLFGFAIYSSTLPDIDHPLSVPGRRHMGFSEFLSSHFGHRGITHYPITWLLMGFIMWFLWRFISISEWLDIVLLWSMIGFLVGYLSHILLDTFNSTGIAWLAPLCKVRVKMPTGLKVTKKRKSWIVSLRYLKGSDVFDNFVIVCIMVGIVLLCSYQFGFL